MARSGQAVLRRTVIKGIGAGLAAHAIGAPRAQAETVVPPQGQEIWSSEYWAKKGDVPLWMYRKRIGAPQAGEPSRPVVFFVHGSSVTSRVFDVSVSGKGEYSVMNEFARYGFDCWTMDHENYGKSGRTSGNSDIASGVEDLKAAVEVIAGATGRQKYHFVGESSGALRAGAYAMVAPERIDRLVFAAFTYKGEGSPTLAKRAEQLDYFRSHNMRKRDRDMIRSIATRDKPGTSDPAVMEALADAELQFGDQVPTGTYLDMTANLPVVHPEKVLAPVLLIRGDHDGIATVADLEEFFNRLPNGDRQFAILPGTAHSVVLAINRQLFWHVTRSFLTMPTPIAT
ncbi:alpha/beta hydrolase [Bradyrhizobium cenepequi]|uniref:alpha/beta hydrolase n=1 Tax=Bradyrhizobium cenepequi TaxID=2821403 RepID=UPI001CE36678|nr:alpha/beta fold hydrolase [Bradyrhizobium cenepequi]MCA6106395.1 alpha/beta fold hydrolase [Bradyrhizobium cenepequi]